MSDLFGTFSEPGSLSTGDPYKKQQDKTGRFGGKQFSTAPPKSGKAPDAYIDKQVRSLALGDRYQDAWILEKRLSRIPGKPVSEKPFYRTVGSNSSITCGPGSNDGVLSKEMPYDTDGSAAALRSNPPRRPADKLRNIYTSAPKKGGYGMPWRDMSLGEPPKYYMDVYDGGRERVKDLRATGKPVSGRPFVSSASPTRPFTPDTKLYSCLSPPPGRSSSSSGAAGSSSSNGRVRASSAPRERQRPQSGPWRPSSPPKQGAAFCVISHVGRNYVPDPVKEAKYHAKEHAAVKPFRPVSGSKARLSMWSPNPYTTDPRPAPDIDFTIT
ncbi:hypothetical protein OEZ86_011064 [Tetradesmus obliquus]|nr:hypothetical protein OEZ86_011064 [Tetradesmus obliquus]